LFGARLLGSGVEAFQETSNTIGKLNCGSVGGSYCVDITVAELEVLIASEPSEPQVEIGETGAGNLEAHGVGSGAIVQVMQGLVEVADVDVKENLGRDAVLSETCSHAGVHEGATHLVGRNRRADCDSAIGAIQDDGAGEGSL